MAAKAPLLSCENLGVARADQLLFQGLNLALHAGDLALLSGANGSGKTSLLRVLAGLAEPATGRIYTPVPLGFFAADLSLPQALHTQAWFGMMAELGPNPNRALDLADWGLAGLQDQALGRLSTGQRQRLRLAALAASGFQVWLLDEPLLGLDAQGQALLQATLSTHAANGGAALIASHQPLPQMPGLRISLVGKAA